MKLYLFHLINISTTRVYFQVLQKVICDIDDIRINIEELCPAASVQFIKDTIIELDPVSKKVKVTSGQSHPAAWNIKHYIDKRFMNSHKQ